MTWAWVRRTGLGILDAGLEVKGTALGMLGAGFDVRGNTCMGHIRCRIRCERHWAEHVRLGVWTSEALARAY